MTYQHPLRFTSNPVLLLITSKQTQEPCYRRSLFRPRNYSSTRTSVQVDPCWKIAGMWIRKKHGTDAWTSYHPRRSPSCSRIRCPEVVLVLRDQSSRCPRHDGYVEHDTPVLCESSTNRLCERKHDSLCRPRRQNQAAGWRSCKVVGWGPRLPKSTLLAWEYLTSSPNW